jgi:hypothetical protein
VKDFLKYQIPAWLTGEKAIEIYSEIKDLTHQFAQEVILLFLSLTVYLGL